MKLDSPAAHRNKEPIWDILASKVLPSNAGVGAGVGVGVGAGVGAGVGVLGTTTTTGEPFRVLEIAAGTGIHTEHFALRFSKMKLPFVWFPTDPSNESLASIQCYIQDNSQVVNVEKPLSLTLDENGIIEKETDSVVLKESMDLIVCINMIHISPWEATLGLMKVAGEKLTSGGYLYCYGPYKVDGILVESNLYVICSLLVVVVAAVAVTAAAVVAVVLLAALPS
jgi:SAM-dependent methyltransferase